MHPLTVSVTYSQVTLKTLDPVRSLELSNDEQYSVLRRVKTYKKQILQTKG